MLSRRTLLPTLLALWAGNHANAQGLRTPDRDRIAPMRRSPQRQQDLYRGMWQGQIRARDAGRERSSPNRSFRPPRWQGGGIRG